MAIRNATKGVLVHDGKVLLNRCRGKQGDLYYALPGGGQNQYETMEEAVVREFLEETGYSIVPGRFLALYEEIIDNPDFREKAPDYAHKIYHIFVCTLASDTVARPSELDDRQEGTQWMPIEALAECPLYPAPIRDHLQALIQGDAPAFLGSTHV